MARSPAAVPLRGAAGLFFPEPLESIRIVLLEYPGSKRSRLPARIVSYCNA